VNPSLHELCLRLECAQAEQNKAMAEADARLNPGGGARCERIAGAYAIHLGPGHMLNQGLALGLHGPMSARDLDQLEAVVGRPTTVELSAGADPSVAPLLAERGYRIHLFQQVWMRDLPGEDTFAEMPGIEARPLVPGEEEVFGRVVFAGFMDTDDTAAVDPTPFAATLSAVGTTCFLAFVDGEPMGAGTVGLSGDVATLSGTSVLPRFRGRGGQGALIRARLAFARAHGCALAASASLPGTPSQANLERCVFRVAYPKLELVRE
jgi:GNAT superfamily N-acetyltransferase